MGHRVSVVVPCFNEASRLRLDQFRDHAKKHPGTTFLYVDDGSTDQTGELLAREAREVPDLARVCSLARNQGKAEAVRQGMEEALRRGTDFVGYWDADLATPLHELSEMVGILKENPALEGVLGSRVMLLGRTIQRHATRHYLGRVFATAASFALELPVYDTQCGAKVFRASDELTMCIQQPFQTRWIFDVELLGRLGNAWGGRGAEKLAEYPVREWNDVAGSKISSLDFLRSGWDLFRVWRGLARERSKLEDRT
jgi:glycosyltransferase involved in cell wall biosynthesis